MNTKMKLKEKIIINVLLIIFVGILIAGIIIYLISHGKNTTWFILGITLGSFYICFYCYYLHFRFNPIKKKPKDEENKKPE